METKNTTTATPAITLSDAALKEVKRLINVQGLTEGGLRVGVKGGGCSGLSYTINFDENRNPIKPVAMISIADGKFGLAGWITP